MRVIGMFAAALPIVAAAMSGPGGHVVNADDGTDPGARPHEEPQPTHGAPGSDEPGGEDVDEEDVEEYGGES